LLIFDEVTDKTKLAPFFMAHGVHEALPMSYKDLTLSSDPLSNRPFNHT